MKKIFYILFLPVIVSVSVQAQKDQSFSWLTGVWKINLPDSPSKEQWKQLNDSTYQLKTFTLGNSGDTINADLSELSYRKGEWLYKGANKVYKVAPGKGTGIVFENQSGDFPGRIGYRRDKNKLLAFVEGKMNGRDTKMEFEFIRE